MPWVIKSANSQFWGRNYWTAKECSAIKFHSRQDAIQAIENLEEDEEDLSLIPQEVEV